MKESLSEHAGDFPLVGAQGPGKPIVESLDVDHDGVPDHIRYDYDGDGNAELVTVDDNNDGVPDTVSRDDDDNGHVEAIFHDYNHDGRFENVWRDTDGDGSIDTITDDADGDGNPEKTQTGPDGRFTETYFDTNDDGQNDYVEYDTDGDGKPDLRLPVLTHVHADSVGPTVELHDNATLYGHGSLHTADEFAFGAGAPVDAQVAAHDAVITHPLDAAAEQTTAGANPVDLVDPLGDAPTVDDDDPGHAAAFDPVHDGQHAIAGPDTHGHDLVADDHDVLDMDVL